MAPFQHTVRSPALFAGIGVHTGAYTRVSVRPAPANHGIVFARTDVKDRDNLVPATGEAVCKTQLGTVIGNAAGVTVSTRQAVPGWPLTSSSAQLSSMSTRAGPSKAPSRVSVVPVT